MYGPRYTYLISNFTSVGLGIMSHSKHLYSQFIRA